MEVLTSDWEVTTWSKGSAFDQRNKAVCLAWKYNDETSVCSFDWSQGDFNCDLAVFFNAKFDLHWYRRVGFKLYNKIWCCQVAEFVLSGQKIRYPSLEETAVKYNLGHKVDIVKEEFWERKCTCHVSIAKQWKNYMQNNFAEHATTINMAKQGLVGLKKKENGEKLIQSCMRLLNSVERKNFGLILKQRLDHVEQNINENMDSQMLYMMSLWHDNSAKFVENKNNLFASITATEQEKFEECCVEHVIALWDMLNETTGWNQHSPICKGHSPVNTDAIPKDILSAYACQDVDLTYLIYLKQVEQFEKQPALYKLFKLMCQDLLVLQEMEWNGQVYDEQLCLQKAAIIQTEINEILSKLSAVYPDIPINFNSPEQISAFLYGGKVYQEAKEHVGFFKTGKQAGQPKYKNVTIEHVLPRLVTPLPNSELAKEGYFKTDEGTLRKLKGPAAKKFVGPLLRLSELDKLNSTYYLGLPKKNQEYHWPKGMIHGQFNQVVAQTGRLSSSNPNLQNFAGDCLDVFVTRYEV